MKATLWVAGAIYVGIWSFTKIWAALTTGVLEMPAARGSSHDHFVSFANEPKMFIFGLALWVLFIFASGYAALKALRG